MFTFYSSGALQFVLYCILLLTQAVVVLLIQFLAFVMKIFFICEVEIFRMFLHRKIRSLSVGGDDPPPSP